MRKALYHSFWTVLVLVLALSGPVSGLAQSETESAKQIIMHQTEKSGNFQVEFAPVKEVFQVGEPISFKIKANKRFFLYLFSIDEKGNRGKMILPHELIQGNMYDPDAEFTVPTSQKVELFSDKPGREKVIMVASTRWLDLDPDKFTRTGKFYTGKGDDIEAEAKSIGQRKSEKGSTVVKEVTLVIAGQAEPAQSGPVGPMPFVSTDRLTYRLNDPVEIVFGADQAGYVALFVVEPEKGPVLLKKQEVSGKEFYKARGKAVGPAGRHLVVAVYTEKDILDDHSLILNVPSHPEKGFKISGESKGILLEQDEFRALAVYPIDIQE